MVSEARFGLAAAQKAVVEKKARKQRDEVLQGAEVEALSVCARVVGPSPADQFLQPAH